MSDTKRIVVTGVGRGLGLAMTEGFIDRGHVVCGCSRSAKNIEPLKKRFPAPHRFDQVDVTDDEQVGRWAQSVLAEGPVDLLINNAALMNESNTLLETPPDEFARLVDVNITGVFHVVRHFVPAMIERASGVIVNFSSAWGRSVSPNVVPYCTTKFAIEGMTKGLAAELPRGMAAVPLNPGVINTDMLQICFGSMASAYPTADKWAEKAVPFILNLDAKDNGQSLSAT